MLKLDNCPTWCTTDHTHQVRNPFTRYACPEIWHRGPVDSAGEFTLLRSLIEPDAQPDTFTEFDLEDIDGEQITLPADPDTLDRLAAMITRTAAQIRKEHSRS